MTAAFSLPCRYLSALRTCFAASGKELVGFERYMALRKSGGNHCHLNAIAVPGARGVGVSRKWRRGKLKVCMLWSRHLTAAAGPGV